MATHQPASRLHQLTRVPDHNRQVGHEFPDKEPRRRARRPPGFETPDEVASVDVLAALDVTRAAACPTSPAPPEARARVRSSLVVHRPPQGAARAASCRWRRGSRQPRRPSPRPALRFRRRQQPHRSGWRCPADRPRPARRRGRQGNRGTAETTTDLPDNTPCRPVRRTSTGQHLDVAAQHGASASGVANEHPDPLVSEEEIADHLRPSSPLPPGHPPSSSRPSPWSRQARHFFNRGSPSG